MPQPLDGGQTTGVLQRISVEQRQRSPSSFQVTASPVGLSPFQGLS